MVNFSLAARRAICEVRPMFFLHRASPLFIALALASCGGSTPPPKEASSDNKESANAPGGGADSAALEDERKAFMKECMESPELEDFCACSFTSISKTTTAEERKDTENPATKKALAALPKECGSKLPKSALKDNFVKACAKSPAMGPFCECSFHFLDGKGMLQSDENALSGVEGEMKAACSKELYELARVSFMEGCGSKQPESVCKCTFGALEKKYGKDKLEAFLSTGSDDVKKAVKSASATCGAK